MYTPTEIKFVLSPEFKEQRSHMVFIDSFDTFLVQTDCTIYTVYLTH